MSALSLDIQQEKKTCPAGRCGIQRGLAANARHAALTAGSYTIMVGK